MFDGLIKALIPLLATSFTGGYSDAFNEILDDNQIASSIGDVRSCVCSATFEVPGLVYEVFGLSFSAPDSLPGQTPVPEPGTSGGPVRYRRRLQGTTVPPATSPYPDGTGYPSGSGDGSYSGSGYETGPQDGGPTFDTTIYLSTTTILGAMFGEKQLCSSGCSEVAQWLLTMAFTVGAGEAEDAAASGAPLTRLRRRLSRAVPRRRLSEGLIDGIVSQVAPTVAGPWLKCLFLGLDGWSEFVYQLNLDGEYGGMGPDGGPEDVYVADGYVPVDGDSVTDTIGIQEPSDGGEGPGAYDDPLGFGELTVLLKDFLNDRLLCKTDCRDALKVTLEVAAEPAVRALGFTAMADQMGAGEPLGESATRRGWRRSSAASPSARATQTGRTSRPSRRRSRPSPARAASRSRAATRSI